MSTVALALQESGWYEGRSVSTAAWEAALEADGFPPLHPAARAFLATFGGLAVPHGGPGITRAREPFDLDPTTCIGEADRFIEWGAHIGRDIAPIGELAVGTCAATFLGIDENEQIYVVLNRLRTFGRMPTAMDALVLGHRSTGIA